MFRKLMLLLVLAFVLLGVISVVSAQDSQPLTIGLMVDQSGSLTIYGLEEEHGFKLGLVYAAGLNPADYATIDDALAAVTLGGRPVQVVMRDNASNADTAASQARELVEQVGAEILVGSPSSGVMTGVQQVAADSDVVLFADPAASPAITGANFNVNTFRVCRNTFQDFLAFAPYATANIGQNFVILAIDNDFGHASANAAIAVLGSAGITFGDTIYAPLDTTDFTQYLQQVLASGANALLPIWAGDSSVTLFQQMAELGVGDHMAVVAAFNSNPIVAASDPSMIGNISWIVYHYSFPNNPVNDWMNAASQQYYSENPDLFTECSFATAQALAAAVNATNGDTTPASLIPALEGLVFQGPKGTYAIRPSDHQALVPMYIAQLSNLTDPDQRYFTLLAEVPLYQIVPPVMLPDAISADRLALDTDFNAMIAQMAADAPAAATPEATPAS